MLWLLVVVESRVLLPPQAAISRVRSWLCRLRKLPLSLRVPELVNAPVA